MSKSEPLPEDSSIVDAGDEARADRLHDHAPPRVVSSEALLGGASQLAIRHNQSIYFLRQTRFGKLILTK